MDLTLLALPVAAQTGSTIVVVVVLLTIVGAAFGMYSRSGSGIS